MPFQKLSANEPSSDFRNAVQVVQTDDLPSPPKNHINVQNKYLGVNPTTELNLVKGVYGNTEGPFDVGMEAVGIVKEVGEGVSELNVGDAVIYQTVGAFAEYKTVEASTAIKTPEASPALLPITVCGITASIALEQKGDLKSNETVLVTAASGATGQFVVQLAKNAGNRVIGTCSSDAKCEYLKSIGCDRPVNYNKEDLGQVLQKEYPDGVNLVFESVGGKLFEDAIDNFAWDARMVTIGMTSTYAEHDKSSLITSPDLIMKTIGKNADIRGFTLMHHSDIIPRHIAKLMQDVTDGKLKPGLDPTQFKGLEAVADAVFYTFERKNMGKVVVEL